METEIRFVLGIFVDGVFYPIRPKLETRNSCDMLVFDKHMVIEGVDPQALEDAMGGSRLTATLNQVFVDIESPGGSDMYIDGELGIRDPTLFASSSVRELKIVIEDLRVDDFELILHFFITKNGKPPSYLRVAV